MKSRFVILAVSGEGKETKIEKRIDCVTVSDTGYLLIDLNRGEVDCNYSPVDRCSPVPWVFDTISESMGLLKKRCMDKIESKAR